MQIAHDEVPIDRAPLEEQAVPSNASAPMSDNLPAENPVDGFNRQQQTTAKKSVQDFDSPASVNVTAGSAEQVFA